MLKCCRALVQAGATSDRRRGSSRPAAPRCRSAERLRRGARVGGERQADQRRKRVRAGLLHDGGAMIFDRALADAEVGGDVLAGMAGEHQLHDLALARGQTGEARSLPPPARADNLAESRVCSRARSMLANSSSRPIGFSMKSAAPAFMASTAIGTSPWPVIMMAGSRVPSLFSRCSSCEPAHAGHPGIDQQAAVAARTIGLEERLGTGVDLDRPAIFLEQIAHRLAHRAVIVDHEDGRRSRAVFGRFGRLPGARWRRRRATQRGSAGSGPSAPSPSPACSGVGGPPAAISRNVSVEMSPVRMMAGIS